MAVLVLVMLMLAMTGHAKCTWCVCKDMSDAMLQKTLDYACGAGADCGPTHQGGPCFQPNTVRSHCSYAVNSYYQKKGQAPGSCDFSGTAAISISDPSGSGCSYPATVSAAAGTGTTTTTPSTTTPVNPTPTTNTPGTTPGTTIGNPSTTTPGTTTTSPYTPSSNGMFGGFGNGSVGPSGSGMNTDISDARSRLQMIGRAFSSFTVVSVMLMLLWG